MLRNLVIQEFSLVTYQFLPFIEEKLFKLLVKLVVALLLKVRHTFAKRVAWATSLVAFAFRAAFAFMAAFAFGAAFAFRATSLVAFAFGVAFAFEVASSWATFVVASSRVAFGAKSFGNI